MYFSHYNPVQMHFRKKALEEKGCLMRDLGKRALVVTGRHSARKSGILEDLLSCFENEKIDYRIYEGAEENPGFECVNNGVKTAKDFEPDFIVGAGGGSPMDTAKAVAVLAKNPELTVEDLFHPQKTPHLPVVCIPSTAGTGSEVTPYSIITLDNAQTKSSLKCHIWPTISFIDPRYYRTMSGRVLKNTALDALMHLLESYLSNSFTPMSDIFAESGLRYFSCVYRELPGGRLEDAQMEKLIMASVLGGMAIAVTGTSLPHGAGYLLTVRHGWSHGSATAVVSYPWLRIHPDRERIQTVLRLLGMKNMEEYAGFIKKMTADAELVISEENLKAYSEEMMQNKKKLANHPGQVSEEDFKAMFRNVIEVSEGEKNEQQQKTGSPEKKHKRGND